MKYQNVPIAGVGAPAAPCTVDFYRAMLCTAWTNR